MTLDVGIKLGRYEILSLLGEGGMGKVFLAEDAQLGRKAALKVLHASVARDDERIRRFVLEAKAASALNHPNILTIYEIGQASGSPFIAAEFIEGETLREKIRAGDMSMADALDISGQVVSALNAAHQAGIIHRDIKPENVMIRADGYVKILDFGLAKLIEKTPSDEQAATRKQLQTQAGTIIGTVAYMSPEQARGLHVDEQSDIFSFGVMLYEMVTGHQPFTGETINHTIVAILENEPPALAQLVMHSPSQLPRIVDRCLAKNADKRYSTAKDLLVDLKDFTEELEFQSKLERSFEMSGRSAALTQTGMAGITVAHARDQINSIAVLPFANMSAEAENEYFCDGLAEELLNALANIDGLRVAARTSSFSFKGKNVEVSLGRAYIASGMHAEAIALSEKALQSDPTNQQMLRVAGYAYAKQGRRAEAEEIIKRFKDLAKTQYVVSYFVANIYAALGDKEKAFAELEKAFAEGDWELHRLKVDPFMDPLRDDPRFKEMLKRLNLPE